MSSIATTIGLNSLLASQAGLETIGHNLSNAITPGYSRQTLRVSPSMPLNMRGLIQGTGVHTDVIARTVDSLLHGRITTQMSSIGRLHSRLDTLANVESFLGGSTDTGLPALFKKMFQSMASLSTAPEDAVLRTSAVQSAGSVAQGLNQLATNTSSLSRDTFLRIHANVQQANSIVEEIGDLNRQIMSSEVGTASANDLRDQRDQKIKELSQYIDLRTVEDGRGAVRVMVGGRILVSPTTTATLEVTGDPSTGDVTVSIDDIAIDVQGGEIGGLLSLQHDFLPHFQDDIDAFARNLILQANRVHSTGVPKSGSFQMLVASERMVDNDQDGTVADELLTAAGLPFDVSSGELYVNVVSEATGAVQKHRIAIDATRMTAGQLAAALDAVPNLSSSLDGQGRLQINADAGYRFDFSSRLVANPDTIGSFGSGRASIATPAAGPYALSDGDTLDFVGPSSSFSVAFDATSFRQINAATADEIAAALNADANFVANGMVANSVGGTLVVQSSGSGAVEQFQVSGGSSLAALGLNAGTTVTGADSSVAPHVSGVYTGTTNGQWTLRPNMDGMIGTTPGLVIEVFDASGAKLADIDVGPGYTPGEEVDVLDGIKMAFGYGQVSASDGDLFQLDVVADSDTSDVLVALGVNSLFTGQDAATIGVNADIMSDPSLLAASVSGAPGDGSNVLRMISIESHSIDALSQKSLDEHLADVVSGVALQIDSGSGAQEAEQFLLDGLEARRDQVSGVNTDEELVHMIEQEQSYQAAARFLSVINEMTNELMAIL
jgi:flagellar hook-associated protein 1